MKVRIKRVGDHTLPVPRYETEGAAGFDLRANVDYEQFKSKHMCGRDGPERDYVWVRPERTIVIPCGFAFEIPVGHEMQVRPRSGLSRSGVYVALGTIDSDYRGEVAVVVTNLTGEVMRINRGDRIAQGIIAPVVRAEFDEVPELSETARGNGGFGSTGK